MAGRILNRRVLRDQVEQAEKNAAAEPPRKPAKGKKAAAAKKPATPKKAAAPKTRKPRAKKGPPRMRARWGIFDSSAKQVAIFDYRDRVVADEKLAAFLAKGKGLYYLQIVKELMPEPEPESEPLLPPPAV